VRHITGPAGSELDQDKVINRAHGDAVAADAYPLTIGHQPTRHPAVRLGQAFTNYVQLTEDGLQPHLAAAGDLPRRRRDDRRREWVSVTAHHVLEAAASAKRADHSGSDDNIEVRRNMGLRMHVEGKTADNAECDPRVDQLRCQGQEPDNWIRIRCRLADRPHDRNVRPNVNDTRCHTESDR
jgi:hypothetical protein